jgi:O-antigen/teichoic acid export membrane protein
LLTLLLGDRWFEAGRYLEIMAPWLFMLWVASPTHAIFIVLRKQAKWLVLQTWLTLARLAAFGLAWWLDATAEWALSAFVTATVACNIVMVTMSLSLIAAEDRARRAKPAGVATEDDASEA